MKKLLYGLLVLLLILIGVFVYLKYGAQTPIVQPTNTPSATATPTVKSSLPFNVAAGFEISIFANNVPGARVIVADPKGTILVSETSTGKVIALPDADGNGVADKAVTVLNGLNKPHGMAFKCTNPTDPSTCTFYVAETNQLVSYDYDPATFTATNKKKLLDLPALGEHFTRTLLFMPAPNDTKLLIAIGSTCNACRESDSRRASILSYDISTGKSEEFAKGLRNSVFMTVHPNTGVIWATEMGRDYLGDNLPPDEINILEQGKNYGWPNCYGKNIHDDTFDKNTYIRNPCMTPFETPSYIDLQAHSAPLGLAFYNSDLLVAYHGSWNRSVPTGYKIVRIKLDGQGNVLGTPEDFITGFLTSSGSKIGRPVDVKIFPSGIYVSDDLSGSIYRVTSH